MARLQHVGELEIWQLFERAYDSYTDREKALNASRHHGSQHSVLLWGVKAEASKPSL